MRWGRRLLRRTPTRSLRGNGTLLGALSFCVGFHPPGSAACRAPVTPCTAEKVCPWYCQTSVPQLLPVHTYKRGTTHSFVSITHPSGKRRCSQQASTAEGCLRPQSPGSTRPAAPRPSALPLIIAPLVVAGRQRMGQDSQLKEAVHKQIHRGPGPAHPLAGHACHAGVYRVVVGDLAGG